jgi:PAS domain S-box-containing protein
MIKILAIDDEKDNLISLEAVIKYALPNTNVLKVLSGAEGIDIAITEDPDVILLDIVMPEMDGFKVCQFLKQDEHTSDIPVIFLTALSGDRDNRIKALEIGVDAFLTKPIDEIELIAQIRAMVKIKSANRIKRNEKEQLELLVDKRTRDLRMSNEALLRNERRMQDIFDSMSEGFSIQDVICDEDGNPIDLRFMEANPAFEKQTGLINSKTLGHTLLELFPTTEKYWVERYGKVGITGEPISFEAMFGPLNIYYHVNAFQTAPRQFGVLFTDINDHKLHEIELTKAKERAEESEKNLKRGQQIGKIGFWKLNTETNEVSGTEELLKIFELDNREFTIDSFLQVVHPDDRAFDLEHVENGIKNGIPWDIEHRLLFEDGKIKWVNAVGEPQFNESNEVYSIIGIVQDITKQKKAEEALIESEKFSNAIIDNSLNAIMVADDLGNYLSVNEAAAEMFGFSVEKMLKMNVGQLRTTTNPNAAEQNILYLEKGQEIGEFDFLHSNGEPRIAEYHAVRVRDNFNLSILSDITDRKIAEIKLVESQNNLSAVFNNTQDAQLLSNYKGDDNFIIVSANTSYIKKINQFGIKISERDIIGKSLKELIFDILKLSQEVFDYTIRYYLDVIESGNQKHHSEHFEINNDSYYSETSYSPIFNSENEVSYVLYNSHDTTEKRIAEVRLTESESNLLALINNSEDSIWSLDRNYNYIIFNKSYADIFFNEYGIELKEGMNAKKFLKSKEYDFWVQLFDEALEGETKVFEFSHDFDGVRHFYQTSLYPIYKEGIITGVSAMSIDITKGIKDKEKIQNQLSDLQRWHDAMINREEKTLELKHEVNELLKQIGKPIRYSSIDKQRIMNEKRNE